MANITRFDPFNDLVDDLFKGYFVRPASWTEGRDAVVRMKVDVAEKGDAYVVHAELPGVRKEDIQVAIDGAQVTLTAEAKRESDAREGERWLHVERIVGKATRSFSLPQELDDANAQATFRDGVLELILPKKAAAARKQIAIN
jgi:HSP20 family protein